MFRIVIHVGSSIISRPLSSDTILEGSETILYSERRVVKREFNFITLPLGYGHWMYPLEVNYEYNFNLGYYMSFYK